ncbi:MAG TPA: tRNA (adenosine(37)-N6)-threonylcarbamoyltransferase complex ATPase subunit type 1 TsaE [Steroidobacteraceae bacterium]|nr:tRNA (adenosine(37)-N6)-threonylcarbamoyltransferase complex ATPase subunit type 1 TsaE [Steroidobacteraceae bacterium]
MSLELSLPGSEHTEKLGAALASYRPRASAGAMIVYLQGELGAGKTTLARGLLRALGVTGVVRSPSYTLLESYESAGLRVFHLDLYRLEGAEDLAMLGWREELTPGALFLIEWPERVAGALPPADLKVALSIVGAGRRARLEAASVAGTAWLHALRSDAALAEMNRV